MDLWQQELSKRIVTLETLEKELELLPSERAWFSGEGAAPRLPFALTRYYLSLFSDSPSDPLRRQSVPRIEELSITDNESDDPLCERNYSPSPSFVHRYEDRALFLAGDQCALYCRHCFRRHYTGRGENGCSLEEKSEAAAAWLEQHSEIRELLISGGDPLMLPDERLGFILETFRAARPDLVFRIGTRMPVVLPSRLTGDLARILRSFAPLFTITQFNHPAEFTEASSSAVARLVDAGIPLLNQSVLLRGVNDSEEVLKKLFSGLVAMRVIPYYLFQPDLAAGTSHLRPSLGRGIGLMRSFRQRLSGLSTPLYAVDLPGGGGKVRIPLEPPPPLADGRFLLKSPDGKVWPYPDEATTPER
jgi:lysine 2,3-aminomutase